MTLRHAIRIASPVAFLVALCWPLTAFAQRGQDAGLVGTVHDTSGAVVAGATLLASSPRLIGGAATAVTDAEGAYRFPFLPPGDYVVVAQRPDPTWDRPRKETR